MGLECPSSKRGGSGCGGARKGAQPGHPATLEEAEPRPTPAGVMLCPTIESLTVARHPTVFFSPFTPSSHFHVAVTVTPFYRQGNRPRKRKQVVQEPTAPTSLGKVLSAAAGYPSQGSPLPHMDTHCCVCVCMSAQPPQLLLPRACATTLGWIPAPLAWNPTGCPGSGGKSGSAAARGLLALEAALALEAVVGAGWSDSFTVWHIHTHTQPASTRALPRRALGGG